MFCIILFIKTIKTDISVYRGPYHEQPQEADSETHDMPLLQKTRRIFAKLLGMQTL